MIKPFEEPANIEELRKQGRNNDCCWIKGCPASMYFSCRAYAEHVDCWEIKEGCSCPRGIDNERVSDCPNCNIYKNHLKELKKKAKNN